MNTRTPTEQATSAHARAKLHYRIEALNPQAHLFGVSLLIHQPAPNQLVSLPVWIPGSYLVREFAKHLQHLSAQQHGQAVRIEQRSKSTWQVQCDAAEPLHLSWQVYAFDASVRTAWLDSNRGFFNGTSVFLRVHGFEHVAHEVDIVAPTFTANSPSWHLATALPALTTDDQGFGCYRAQDYDQLVDCPVEMGPFWQGEFKARGIAHRFVVSGAPPSFDGARLLADAQRICETVIDFWHPPHSQTAEAVSGASTASAPAFQNYLFLLNAVQDGYGGLEHCNSTALICQRADLPRFAVASNDETSAPQQAHKAAPPNEGYTTLLGLISHEYFHAWNVKCLRPAELIPYDYTQENYTQLLWFFEGFTSYYDDLLLRRAQLIDDATYLSLVQKNLRHLAQTPGRLVHSVAQASFEAWTKYYRPDENTPNATVSYYAKGAALALCLDLSLRQHSQQAGLASVISLDDVMREVWKRTGASDQQPGSVTESILLDALQSLTGRDWRTPLLDWVHGTQALPTHELLRAQGVAVSTQAPSVAQRLGLRASDAHEPSNRSGAVKIKQVLRGSPAEQAGFAAGDEWLGVNDWRLQKLNDLPLLLPAPTGVQAQDICKALVSRDGRLLRLDLPLAAIQTTLQAGSGSDDDTGLATLAIEDPKRVSAWLA